MIKFTPKKWAKKALAGEGLKIGTTRHYREIEDERFRDEDEGGRRIAFQPKHQVTAKEFNRIFKHEGYMLDEKWKINFGRVPLLSERSQFSTYVFCCSLINDESEIEKLAEIFDADDYFSISDPAAFRNLIGIELRR